MNVICHAANFDGRHFIGAGNAAKIRPKAFLKVRRDERTALLGAPHTMQMAGNECVQCFCRPYGTWLVCDSVNPPLKRWAIVFRAKGAFGFLTSSGFMFLVQAGLKCRQVKLLTGTGQARRACSLHYQYQRQELSPQFFPNLCISAGHRSPRAMFRLTALV